MTLFAYIAHLWQEDRELSRHDDDAFLTSRRRATDDVLRDLDRHGVDAEHIEDAFAHATVELEFTATDDGGLTVPAGTVVSNVDPAIAKNAGVQFKADEELVVGAGQTDTVLATSVDPGAPANVDAGELVHLVGDTPTNFDAVTNMAAADGGIDHQMTRAATYRAMEMIYLDLQRTSDDAYSSKRRVYGKLYREEIERTIAAGIRMDANQDGTADRKTHGLKRFRRS
jgi:hypothetical protein